MNGLNMVAVEGYLTRDAQLRETPSGRVLCAFSIGYTRYYKAGAEVKSEVSFFDCLAWEGLARSVARLGGKGRGARVTGRLRQERWSGDDGTNKSRVVIIAERVEFRSAKSDDGEAEGGEAEGIP